MLAQQLWLFPEPKPLRERLGDAFFRSIPSRPGVYVMTDSQERVLYVGQSKNLRQRLHSYKNVRPEKDARKLVRLVQAVRIITWEECSNPHLARLRENELLRLFKPKFNRVNTRPEAYGYIGLRARDNELEIWLAQEYTQGAGLYGAFKGARIQGYASLLRLFVSALQRPNSLDDWPARVLDARPPRRFTLRLNPASRENRAWGELLRKYLEGSSDELMARLIEALPSPDGSALFWRNLQNLDLETVQGFYLHGPRRNRILRERHGLAEEIIAPPDLDDLLVTPVDSELDG